MSEDKQTNPDKRENAEDVEAIRAQSRAHYWGEEYRHVQTFEEAQAIYRRRTR